MLLTTGGACSNVEIDDCLSRAGIAGMASVPAPIATVRTTASRIFVIMLMSWTRRLLSEDESLLDTSGRSPELEAFSVLRISDRNSTRTSVVWWWQLNEFLVKCARPASSLPKIVPRPGAGSAVFQAWQMTMHATPTRFDVISALHRPDPLNTAASWPPTNNPVYVGATRKCIWFIFSHCRGMFDWLFFVQTRAKVYVKNWGF